MEIGIRKTVLKNKMQMYDKAASGVERMSNSPRIRKIRPAGTERISTRRAKPEFLSTPKNSSS